MLTVYLKAGFSETRDKARPISTLWNKFHNFRYMKRVKITVRAVYEQNWVELDPWNVEVHALSRLILP
jgi:hypothetical protein